MTKTEEVARLELQAKSMAQQIVREKVEEHKHKEDVKQRELQGLHDRAVSNLEDTKEEKQHLREENVRLKQELRSVKIQLSKQHATVRVTRAFLACEPGNVREARRRRLSNLRARAIMSNLQLCASSGESAMYSMNSFTTSAIPLNCESGRDLPKRGTLGRDNFC